MGLILPRLVTSLDERSNHTRPVKRPSLAAAQRLEDGTEGVDAPEGVRAELDLDVIDAEVREAP